MNISIIIPNYNGAKLLTENLPKVLDAVRNYKDGFVEIIIPDDPSTDNSKDIIEEFIDGIKESHVRGITIENRDPGKSGFSKNVNRGVALAKGDVLILFNSDVAPRKDFLKPLISHFQEQDVFAVGCMDESHENNKTILRGRGLGEFKKGFLVHRAGNIDKDNTLWVSGGSGAFRKSTWDKLGGLDPLYDPFYWEDIDLSYRALKSGYKIVFEPKSIVTHRHEEGIVRTEFSNKFVKQISYKNQFVFVWKNLTDIDLVASHFLWLPYLFLKSLVNGNTEFFVGFYLALKKVPQILRMRSYTKKYFVKKDSEVIESIRDFI